MEGPGLDLAFVVDDHLSPDLMAQAGSLAGGEAAEERWSALVARWMAELGPELPSSAASASLQPGVAPHR